MPSTAAETSVHREAWRVFTDVFLRDKPRRMAAVNEMGLTMMQAFALGTLGDQGPMTMSQLAERMQCDNSNITGIADRLEALGYAERQAAPRDRRVKTLVLTDAGHDMRRRVKAVMGEPPPGWERLTREEVTQLRDLLKKTLD